MDSNGNNGPNDDAGGGEWGGRKRRDDTPSFIRDAQARAEMLNPVRTGEHIPVLTMPSSVKMWRKIRWPLLVFIVLGVLVAVGLFTNDRLVARRIARKVADAKISESAGTIDGLTTTSQELAALSDRHPGRTNAQVAYAWHSVLLAELFGPTQQFLEPASDAFDRIGSDSSSMGMAALAGRKYLKGDPAGGLALAEKGLGSHRDEPRLHLVRALCLRALDKKEEAAAVLAAVRKSSADYIPALHVALSSAIEDGDLAAAKDYYQEMILLSPGNLYGTLASIIVSLPRWNEPLPQSSVIAKLHTDMQTVRSRLDTAPPKIKVLGTYASGRVSLLAGNLGQAVKDLKIVTGVDDDREVLAWYAMAVGKASGPKAALEILSRVGSDPGPEISSIRARCYLDYHQVLQAEEALQSLGEDSGSTDAAELAWILAVRKGDIVAAKEKLPQQIDSRLMWVALEMLDLARWNGDSEAITSLAERFTGDAQKCSEGINTWMDGRVNKIYRLFGAKSDDECIAALSVKLMRGHMSPSELKTVADGVVASAGGELTPRVDMALALWLAEGQSAAAAALQEVLAQNPEGEYIKCAIADVYLKMGMFAEGSSVLEGLSTPVALSLRLKAASLSGDRKAFGRQLASALKVSGNSEHPAVVYWKLKNKFDLGEHDKVVLLADGVIKSAGTWTAEIAELKARSQNAMGSRGDADRGLLAAAKIARSGVGVDEAWEAKVALIRLNLRRGGNFLFKAVGVTLEMYKSGIKDAELSYSYAVANIRQGNERGAMRYLREAIELDPSFVPPYSQLNLMGKLSEEQRQILERTRPGTSLE